MLLGQILVVCFLLIGSHGNMSPDSKITCSKGPPDAASLPRGTHQNASQEVYWNPDPALAYDANIATLSYNWRSINFVYILVTLYLLTFRSIQVL